MIFRAPRPSQLPHIQTIVDDLPAHRDQVAKHLDITPATLARYIKTGNAPRAVQLALFWETRWGLSITDVDLYNLAQVHRQHAQGLRDHIGRMAGVIWGLEVELTRHQAGRPANLPIFRVA